jgi:chromosome segregation ATPase
MAGKPVRSGSEATQRLEELRAAYDRLRTEQIRAEGEAERLEQELEIARAEARAEFGTDDENALAGMIAEAEARNAARVQEFEAVIASIEAELASLAREGA